MSRMITLSACCLSVLALAIRSASPDVAEPVASHPVPSKPQTKKGAIWDPPYKVGTSVVRYIATKNLSVGDTVYPADVTTVSDSYVFETTQTIVEKVNDDVLLRVVLRVKSLKAVLIPKKKGRLTYGTGSLTVTLHSIGDGNTQIVQQVPTEQIKREKEEE